MKLATALLLALLGTGTAAASPAFHVTLDSVQIGTSRGLVRPLTGTIRNDGADSLFLQGVVTDLPSQLGGDDAAAAFLAAAPAALGPGEAWKGEILTLHAAPDATPGSYVCSVAVLGAGGVYDPVQPAGTNFAVVVDTTATAGVGDAPIQVERLLTAPNPSRGGTGVWLDLRTGRDIDVTVVDVTGRLVRRLFQGRAEAGRRQFAWNGTDAGGRRVGPGVYLVLVRSGTTRFLSKTVELR